MERISKHELKRKFKQTCPEEAAVLETAGSLPETLNFAACVWKGYKAAYKELGILVE